MRTKALLLALTALAIAAGAAPVRAEFPAAPQAQSFDLHLQRGLQLLQAGRAPEAVVELEAAVAQRPDSAEAQYHLGRALMTAGRPRDAVPHLELALRDAPEPGPVHFLLAQVLLELEELEAAGKELDAAAASRPGFAPIEYYRAELCYLLGKVDTARARFEAVAQAAPGWNLPLVRSGMIALDDGDATQAIERFNAALALNESNPTLWMRLASAYVADGNTDEAVRAYRKAVEVGPRFTPARMALVGQLNAQRDYEGMRGALDDLLALQPGHPLAEYQLASLLSTQGDNEQALAAVDVAVAGFDAQAAPAGVQEAEQHTYRALSRGLRAQILMKLGRDDEAIEEAQRLVESDPSYPDAHFVLGTLQLRRRDPSGREQLEIFKQLSDAREHREQADARLRADDLERAAGEYEQALQADPQDSASLIGLATVRRRQGDAAAALELLERADPRGVETVPWYRERILALDAAGRSDEAMAAWQVSRTRGLDLGPEVWAVTRRDIPGCG
ncbi:MAG: tetratricopeptide repeat protein [Acidobacteriota bacterium]|jgi:tetratricopeptide (TPR) repeat protein